MSARRLPRPVAAHALRRQVLSALALGGAGLALVMLLLALAFGLGAGNVAVAAALYGGIGIAILRGLRFLGGSRFGAANLMTLGRGAITAALAGLATAPPQAGPAWAMVALAVTVLALDGVDGWLARRLGTATDFGARFDMEVDALLILVLAVAAMAWDKAGAWILLAGLLRYLFVAAGMAWPVLAAPLPPSFRRKLVCVVQIVALIVILAPVIVPPASTAVAAASLVLLAWSFAVDTAWALRHG